MDIRWLLTDTGHSLLQPDGGVSATLALTPAALAQRCWPGRAPQALDLERAIDVVEDAIEASGLRHAPRGRLWLPAPLLPLLVPLLPAGLLQAAAVPRDQVEAAFSAMLRDLGPRAAPAGSHNGEAAAALLMLRELMHHLGLAEVAAAAA